MNFREFWKKKNDKDTKWITVNGAHIPVEDGQSKKDAVKQHIRQMDDDEFKEVARLARKVPHIHVDDVAVMRRFINAVDSKDNEKLDGEVGDDAEKLAEYWEINPDKGKSKGLSGIAAKFKDILEGKKKVKGTANKSFKEYWRERNGL